MVIPKHPTLEYLFYAGQLFTGFLVAVFGEWTTALQVLAIMIGIDYLTGIARAWLNPEEQLDSDIGFTGIVKKVGYFCLVAIVFQLGLWMSESMATAMFLRSWVVGALIVNEAVSAFENIARFGDGSGDYLPASVISFAEEIVKKELDLPQSYYKDKDSS